MIKLPVKSFLPFKINLSNITNIIYLGSIDDAYNYKKLQKLDITHILNTAKEIPNFYPNIFNYKKINGIDRPNFDYSIYLDDVANFINYCVKNNKKILIHCFCGISRSTSAIIAYLIKYRNMTFENALSFIKSKRKIVCPNYGFEKNLKQFYNKKNYLKFDKKHSKIKDKRVLNFINNNIISKKREKSQLYNNDNYNKRRLSEIKNRLISNNTNGYKNNNKYYHRGLIIKNHK